MKTLYVVRHAKSSWDYPQLKDFERPLIEKGVKRTKKVAAFLKAKEITLDLIVTSHATRALETAQLLAKELKYPGASIFVNPDIYNADDESIFSVIYAFPDDKNNILMVGHNPTFTQLANYFLKEKIHYLPTSAVVSLSFDTNSWSKIDSCDQHINFVAIPKKL